MRLLSAITPSVGSSTAPTVWTWSSTTRICSKIRKNAKSARRLMEVTGNHQLWFSKCLPLTWLSASPAPNHLTWRTWCSTRLCASRRSARMNFAEWVWLMTNSWLISMRPSTRSSLATSIRINESSLQSWVKNSSAAPKSAKKSLNLPTCFGKRMKRRFWEPSSRCSGKRRSRSNKQIQASQTRTSSKSMNLCQRTERVWIIAVPSSRSIIFQRTVRMARISKATVTQRAITF